MHLFFKVHIRGSQNKKGEIMCLPKVQNVEEEKMHYRFVSTKIIGKVIFVFLGGLKRYWRGLKSNLLICINSKERL